VGGWVRFGEQTRVYFSERQSEVMREIVAFIDPALEYRPEGSIPFEAFVRAGIVSGSIDRYTSDDLVKGRIGNTPVSISEVHAEEVTVYRDSDGDTHESWKTLFRGLFFISEFNKHFKGSTYALSDDAERRFGTLGRAVQSWGGPGELVLLEDPEFESEFVVYSSDQQEARYILTPALMRRMLELRLKSEQRVQFSFVGAAVHVAIPAEGELFEPSVLKGVGDREVLRRYHDLLRLAVSVVEEFSLNTRIWSKS